ncbi:hypothetical protein SAMN05421812_12824 [Asanoa hainanensis]|uniref:Uncharacterized protein n=1 Tax=Asanoa hainanensis TaxID=560556 RepID=A0A239PH11_9ACTN|nr:hypothetical protein [Asanoa hainanensis]SNT65878.1 hypothetical protein SAMN05421812_12824 [Asanoa hainanensis]
MERDGWEPTQGFRQIFTRLDLGQERQIAVLGPADAIEWARAHGYRVREVWFGETKAYELSSAVSDDEHSAPSRGGRRLWPFR